ncbi:hypothetical protein NFI95_05785 [Acetobacteraceae bacterium KSS8]|uniref:Uncharacterized protein n=1 Tax=Endosaccharibacter trunci TaxID=2812733 RepID=A0ABT1W509_9PROT|nr:hypothetical protein [Acetobacteraceae bacterium KSS8]
MTKVMKPDTSKPALYGYKRPGASGKWQYLSCRISKLPPGWVEQIFYGEAQPSSDDVQNAARFRWCLEQDGFDLNRLWKDSETLEDICKHIDAAIRR